MDMFIYPNSACLLIAEYLRVAFAPACVIKLWKAGEITPSRSTTIEQLDDAECDFSGYAAQTITAWPAVYLYPNGGGALDMPTENFIATTATPFVENIVGGFWIEDADSQLLGIGVFGSTVPIAEPGNAVPISFTQVFCRPPV